MEKNNEMSAEEYIKQLKEQWDLQHVGNSIYQSYKGSLFHYTTRENLWNIIDSDCFYARHVRFSNDSEEYIIGKKQILTHKTGIRLPEPDDYYMICFCKKGNILSQWREYARGGVSMEMDFYEERCYTIRCNKATETKNREEKLQEKYCPYHIPKKYYRKEKNHEIAYTRPVPVIYIRRKDSKVMKYVREIREVANKGSSMQAGEYINMLLPYFKHIGFKEEQEVRLIFNFERETREHLVDYIDSDGTKKPFIRVEMDDRSKKDDDQCEIKYYKIPTEIENELLKAINERNGSSSSKLIINMVEEDIQRKKKDYGHIYIGNCKEQEKVFQMVDHYVSSYNSVHNKKISIWCEGHLPIRSIMVGPSYDREELRESIIHNMQMQYWTKYVTVDISDIPYRAKIK